MPKAVKVKKLSIPKEKAPPRNPIKKIPEKVRTRAKKGDVK
jgi:hypothetical protein